MRVRRVCREGKVWEVCEGESEGVQGGESVGGEGRCVRVCEGEGVQGGRVWEG